MGRFFVRHALALVLGALFLLPLSGQSLRLVSDPWPPYGYDAGGTITGSDVELLRQAAARSGITVAFAFVPWSRALEQVRSGQADGIFSLYDLPERRDFLLFPAQALSQETLRVYGRAGDARLPLLRGLDNLTGLRVGVLQDNTHGAAFDAATSFTREVSADAEQALRKLAAGRMDVQVLNEAAADYLLNGLPALKAAVAKAPFVVNRQNLYVGFSKASARVSAAFVERFSRALASLDQDGTRALLKRRFGVP